MGYIYRIISPSGKCYIGQTTRSVSDRWDEHIYNALNTDHEYAFYRAIRKYPLENFIVETLLECNDRDLNDFEMEMIWGYGSVHPHGYNMNTGGGAGSHLSESTKEALHHAKLAAHADKFPELPSDLVLPRYLIRWRKSDVIKGKKYSYSGFAIHGHPKCKHKFFGKKSKTWQENLDDAKMFLTGLDNNTVSLPVPEVLPEGIKRRRSGDRDGYEASFTCPDGSVIKRRFTSKYDLPGQLQDAINWLAECRSTTKRQSAVATIVATA